MTLRRCRVGIDNPLDFKTRSVLYWLQWRGIIMLAHYLTVNIQVNVVMLACILDSRSKSKHKPKHKQMLLLLDIY